MVVYEFCLGPQSRKWQRDSASRPVSIGREKPLQSKFLDRLVRLWHSVGSQQGNIHPLDSNDLHIHDADETQDLTQVRLDKIPRALWAFRKNAARSQNQDGLFVLRQTKGAAIGVPEGSARPRDQVDPGFEGGGNAEIPHRRCDHQKIGFQKLAGQLIRLAGRLF